MSFPELYRFLFPQGWLALPDMQLMLLQPTFHLGLHHILLNTALLGLALLWGLAFTSHLIHRERLPQAAGLYPSALLFASLAVGFALMIAQLFSLVLLHCLTSSFIAVFFTLSSVISSWVIFRSRQSLCTVIIPVRSPRAIFGGVLLLALFVYQLSSLSYPQTGDATSYHLPYADFFLLNQGLSAIPEHLIYPYQSLNFNLLYSLGTLIDRDLVYLQTIHALFATLTLFGIYVLSLSLSGRYSVAFLAACLFVLTAKAVTYNRIGANVDCGSMFYVLSTAVCLLLWSKTRWQWLLMLSAVSLGMAMGTKYLMCIFALPVAVCICLTEKKLLPRSLFIFAAWAAVWGLWWYVRNLALTGNPVHPFASNLFGQYLWNDQDMSFQMGALLDTRVPRSFLGFVLMPWYATQNVILVDQGIHYILFALYISTLGYRLAGKTANLLLPFAWIYLIAWFMGAQDPRYLMPIMPLVAIHFSMMVNGLLERIRTPALAKIAATGIMLIVLASLSSQLQSLLSRGLFSGAAMSPAQTEIFLRQNPAYDLVSHANHLLPAHATVYEFFMREIRWFATVNLVGNQFGPHSYYRTIDNTVNDGTSGGMSPVKLEARLKEMYNADAFIIPPPPYIIYNQQQFDEYFTVLYRNQGGTLYALHK